MVAFIVVLGQMFIEGMRWQMYIAYILTGIIALPVLLGKIRNNTTDQSNQTPKKPKRLMPILGAILGMLLLGITTFLANLLHMPTMPAPTGVYEVGTSYFHMIDEKREETATADTNDSRSLWVKVCYPAEQTDSYVRESVLPETEHYLGVVFKQSGFPEFMAGHVPSIMSHSYLDAPLVSGNQAFPIILYSPVFQGNLSENTQKMEELASHGYVVFSVAHPYNAQLSMREDGGWIIFNDSNRVVLPTFADRDTTLSKQVYRWVSALKKRIGSPYKLEPQDRQIWDSLYQMRYPIHKERLAIRAADLSFVLDEVEQMQNGKRKSVFAGRLDTKRVGAFGASFGGPTATLFNAIDSRCLASACVDGTQFGVMIKHTLNKPHMSFEGQYGWEREFNVNDWENIGNAKPYYRVAIQGVTHTNITDQWFNSALLRKSGLMRLGSIKPNRINSIYNSYLLAFFDAHIKGIEQPLLKDEKRFEEVKFKKY